MSHDEAWKNYTDESVERLERGLEYTRRARFLRYEGFTTKQIAERLNALGVKNTKGSLPTANNLHFVTHGVEPRSGHGRRGRRNRKSNGTD